MLSTTVQTATNPCHGMSVTVKVLIVDDYPLFVEGLRSLLLAYDFDVVGTACDGLHALAQVRALRPDLVLMDIAMPVLDGCGSLRLIKAEFPDVKVVMLTMYDDDEHLYDAIRCGADGYLLKSMGSAELVELIQGLQHGEAAISRSLMARIMEALARQLRQQPAPAALPAPELNDLAMRLTPRQMEIVRRVARGQTYPEIAAELEISGRTVQYHMGEILKKLHLRNRTQVIIYAQSAMSPVSPRDENIFTKA